MNFSISFTSNTFIEITIIRSTRDRLNLRFIDDVSKAIKSQRFENSFKNSNQWCLTNDLVERMNMSKLISTLIGFVKKQRRNNNDEFINLIDKYRCEQNVSWMMNMYVSLHDSLTCWIRDEKDSINMKKLIEKKVRCKSHWQNESHWKRNYVWMQKFVDIRRFSSDTLNEKLIKQLQIILFVEDSRRVFNQIKSTIYFDVLLNVMRIWNKSISNEIIDMIELQTWFKKINENSKTLEVKKFYSMFAIIRSAHVMSSDEDRYYVNNYVNWDTYNNFYHKNFKKNDNKKTKEYKKALR